MIQIVISYHKDGKPTKKIVRLPAECENSYTKTCAFIDTLLGGLEWNTFYRV